MNYKSSNYQTASIQRFANEIKKENKLDFYHYILILNCIFKSKNADALYDCLEEFEENLDLLDSIEGPQDPTDGNNLMIFFNLLNYNENDIRIKSAVCLQKIISKSNEIGIFFFNSNIIGIINEQIENKDSLVMMYRFFSIIQTLSEINRDILIIVLKTFPLSNWKKIISIDSIPDQFGQFLVTATSFDIDDTAFHENIILILQEVLRTENARFYQYIAHSIEQLLNYKSFKIDLVINSELFPFIISLLSNIDLNLTEFGCNTIAKLLNRNIAIDEEILQQLVLISINSNSLNNKSSSVKCLTKLINNMKGYEQYVFEHVVKRNIIQYFIDLLDSQEIDFNRKLIFANFIIAILSIADYYFIDYYIQNNIIEKLSFVFFSHSSNTLHFFQIMLNNMKEQFIKNGSFDRFQMILKEQLPLDELLSLSDDEFHIMEIINTIINENSK